MSIKSDSEIELLLADEPTDMLAACLGGLSCIPKRWGRMNRLSRLLLIHTAELLASAGYDRGVRLVEKTLNVGLIGISNKGSLGSDLDFLATMDEGVGLASPAVFGYTLPNIPLAEVAVAFGLTGPVYALLVEGNQADFLLAAEDECRLYFDFSPRPDFMIACAFDSYRESGHLVENLKMSLVQ